MKTIRSALAIILLIILVPTTFIGGRLSDFKDDLKNSDSSTSSSTDDKSSSSSTDDDDDDDSSFFGSLLGAIFGELFKYNSEQTFSQYPYQHPNVPFNLHVAPNETRPVGRKKWTLATTIEYQRFDDQLNALVLDLDFTFAGFLKLRLTSNSLQEEMFDYKDSMTLFNFMFGLDIITAKNFIMGTTFGLQKVTDLNADMFAYNFYMQIFPGKPVVLDLKWTGAIYDNVTTEELKFRLGFLVGMYDFGIGYSWLRLNKANAMNAINFSVRFWM